MSFDEEERGIPHIVDYTYESGKSNEIHDVKRDSEELYRSRREGRDISRPLNLSHIYGSSTQNGKVIVEVKALKGGFRSRRTDRYSNNCDTKRR